MSIQYLAGSIRDKDARLDEIDAEITKLAKSIQYVEKLTAIPGLGERIISGILSEIGDLTRFDDVKGIQKYSGLGLVSESSGKHNGETHISHRGRKRLRYWLYIGAKSVVAHSRDESVSPVLHNEEGQSAQEDAIVDGNCVQTPESHIRDSNEGGGL